jgi:hypothetical protein
LEGKKEEKLAEGSGYENLSENFCPTMVGESSFYRGSLENIQNKNIHSRRCSDSKQ